MASFRQSKHAFTPQDLEALDLALAGALATAKELGVKRRGLQGVLRRRLVDVASKGVTDPEALRDEALKELNIDRIAN